MSDIGKMIRQERKRKGMSQEKLASLIPGVCRSTISRYENGEPVPHDNLELIVEALRSPRLRLEALGGVIPCMYLDNVNLDPLATQRKAIEEMREATEKLENLDLINKIGPEDLTEKERESLIKDVMLELQEVNACMDLILLSMSEKYDIDLGKLHKLFKSKMIKKGYRKAAV